MLCGGGSEITHSGGRAALTALALADEQNRREQTGWLVRKTIGAVLEQQCAMKPATKAKDGLVVLKTGARGEQSELLVSWCVEELAPGYHGFRRSGSCKRDCARSRITHARLMAYVYGCW